MAFSRNRLVKHQQALSGECPFACDVRNKAKVSSGSTCTLA